MIWTGIDQLSVVLTGHDNVNTNWRASENYHVIMLRDCVLCLVAQSCPTLCDPRVHQAPLSMRILQARILEWVAMPSSRADSSEMYCIVSPKEKITYTIKFLIMLQQIHLLLLGDRFNRKWVSSLRTVYVLVPKILILGHLYGADY